LGRLNLKLSETLEETFRKLANEKFGYKLGALNKALDEAVEMWVAAQAARSPSSRKAGRPSTSSSKWPLRPGLPVTELTNIATGEKVLPPRKEK